MSDNVYIPEYEVNTAYTTAAYESLGIADVSGKADKVAGAAAGDFAGLDSEGNLTDSGSKASDFALANHTHDTIGVTQIAAHTYNSRFGYSTDKHLNVFNLSMASPMPSICWPWVMDVSGRIASPLAKYYMIFTTDHANPGKVALAYSDDPLSGWTFYGVVYDAEDAETASVMWDGVNSRFIMYYQCKDAYTSLGETQSTLRLTSADCIHWSNRAKNFTFDAKNMYGNGHNGYFTPFRVGGLWAGYSLMGGGNGGRAVHYSEDGYTWHTDDRQLGFWCLTDPTVSPQRWLAPHQGGIVFMRGSYYFIGTLKNYTSGTTAQDNKLVAVLMNDIYTPAGTPEVLTEMTDAAYESADIRDANVFEFGGKIYIYYQCGTTAFNCLVLSPDSTAASAASDTRYTITKSLTNCAISSGATAAEEKSAYTATLSANTGYTLTGAAVTVTMGGVDITSAAYSNGVISIPSVTGNIVITASAAVNASTVMYTVTNTLTNCTTGNSAAEVTEGASYSATLTALSGYTLTGAAISITMGGTNITSSAYSGGVISIPSVTGNIVITVTAAQIVTYTVTKSLTDCTTSNTATSIVGNASYSATLTASSGYTLTGASVTITMGGVDITSSAYSDNAVTIAAVTGNIVITVSAVAGVITITQQPSGLSGSSGVLTVTASSSIGLALTYQWYINSANDTTSGSAISGATAADYTVPFGSDEGTYYYYCIISDGSRTVTSDAATVVIAYTSLAQYSTVTGTAGGAITSPLTDTTGNGNNITVNNVTAYASESLGGGITTDAANESLVISSVNLGGHTSYRIYAEFRGAYASNNRLFVVPTLDINIMTTQTSGVGYGIKIETTSSAFTSPVTLYAGTEAILYNFDNLKLWLTVVNDVVDITAVFSSATDSSTATGSFTITGLTAALTSYGLYIGNRPEGDRPAHRTLTGFSIKG